MSQLKERESKNTDKACDFFYLEIYALCKMVLCKMNMLQYNLTFYTITCVSNVSKTTWHLYPTMTLKTLSREYFYITDTVFRSICQMKKFQP